MINCSIIQDDPPTNQNNKRGEKKQESKRNLFHVYTYHFSMRDHVRVCKLDNFQFIKPKNREINLFAKRVG